MVYTLPMTLTSSRTHSNCSGQSIYSMALHWCQCSLQFFEFSCEIIYTNKSSLHYCHSEHGFTFQTCHLQHGILCKLLVEIASLSITKHLHVRHNPQEECWKSYSQGRVCFCVTKPIRMNWFSSPMVRSSCPCNKLHHRINKGCPR